MPSAAPAFPGVGIKYTALVTATVKIKQSTKLILPPNAVNTKNAIARIKPLNKTETVVQNKVEKQVVPYILREIVNKTETEVQPQVKHETKTTNHTIVQPYIQREIQNIRKTVTQLTVFFIFN